LTLEGFQPGTIGSAGRGICQGPGLVQADLSLYRNTRISDRVKARLRFEMFNIFDNTNFLSNTGFNTTFDLTTATYDADPADATTIPGYTFSLNFGQASAARGARQAQFGIELIQDFVVKEDGRPREIAPAAGEEQEEPRRTEELRARRATGGPPPGGSLGHRPAGVHTRDDGTRPEPLVTSRARAPRSCRPDPGPRDRAQGAAAHPRRP
jgi:hypothetical protein